MKKLGLAVFCLFFSLAISSVASADSLYSRSWQIVSNLKEEVKSNSNDPGMIWNPANPEYLLRKAADSQKNSRCTEVRLTILGALDKSFCINFFIN
jgi:hypothetical protein